MATGWLLVQLLFGLYFRSLSCTLRAVVDCGSIMLDPGIATLTYDTYANHFEQYLIIVGSS